MKKLKVLVLTYIMAGIFTMPAFSLELDLSVDEEIKKKYDTSKIEYDVLPNLPKVTSPSNTPQNYSSGVPQNLPTYSTSAPQITKADIKTGIKIPQWTKFQVKSNQTISDWSQKGSYVTFTSTSPVYKKNITIPTGTKFHGLIVNSHRPQNSGNGGLVVIRITSMTYKGKTYNINGKITKANTKKIFFNNIKGKRQYLAGVGKRIEQGENFYKKTRKTTNKMADNPILVILSPIPTIVGVAGYSVCTILSPFTALTTKGGNLSIPSGSNFEIKLLDSAYVQ